jgi:lipopolysaccharide transport system permease protein
VPPQWRWLLALNPMTGIVEGFRAACFGRPFDAGSLLLSAAGAALLVAAGVAYFEKVERRFADII